MLKNLRENKSGIIFVTVLMITVVMIAITITILSMNVTRVTTSEEEVRRIQAEMLAVGAMSYGFASQISATPDNDISFQETIGNTVFSVDIERHTADTSGPANTNPLEISVTY